MNKLEKIQNLIEVPETRAQELDMTQQRAGVNDHKETYNVKEHSKEIADLDARFEELKNDPIPSEKRVQKLLDLGKEYLNARMLKKSSEVVNFADSINSLIHGKDGADSMDRVDKLIGNVTKMTKTELRERLKELAGNEKAAEYEKSKGKIVELKPNPEKFFEEPFRERA